MNMCLRRFLMMSILLLQLPQLAQASQVIYDYPLEISSLQVVPYTPHYETNLPAEAIPVELLIKGSLPSKSGKEIEETLSGISLPYGAGAGAYTFQSLYIRENVLFAVNSYLSTNQAKALAEVDSEGQVLFYSEWIPEAIYREYRYTLQDKLSALLFGAKVKNQEDLSLSLRKSP